MWEAFFKAHQTELEFHYPGLTIQRFLKEINDLQHIDHLSQKLLEGVPFNYLRGWSDFYYLKLLVSPAVLIPRPETEYLVDLIVQNQKKYHRALDVGVGSGAIILALMKSGKVKQGVGVDLSFDALQVAIKNAEMNQVKIDLIQGDRLEKVEGVFDLIVSNPPYIKRSEHLNLVHPSVLKYEPHQALFLEDNQYNDWFSILFKQVYQHLSSEGDFYLEGHENTLEELYYVCKKIGFQSVVILNDLTQRKRFIKATK